MRNTSRLQVSKKGFTLIEVLVAISIFGVVGLILSDLLLRTFRGGNKTQILGVIKQNGQSALNTIDQQVRGSDRITCVSPAGDVLVIKKENQFTRFKYNPGVVDLSANPPIYKNGNLAVDYPSLSSLELEDTLCANPSQIAPKYLTDTHTSTGVSVLSASFKRNRLSGYKDVVNVQFSIGPAVQSSGSYDSQIGQANGIQFETTVEIR